MAALEKLILRQKSSKARIVYIIVCFSFAQTFSINTECAASLPPREKSSASIKSPPADSARLSRASAASTEPSGSSEAPRGVIADKKKAKRTLKVKAFVPGAVHTPKNVCARLWVEDNPGGTKDDFETYFSSLTAATANEFKKQAAALKKNQ
ncbi:hypothetical protein ARMSODRAFT_1011228 [Armillaria solidipes]|uniref:Uncharacterized protein n=1 Tax=Armillaria solidipes TaxID=1076256 RepID=A0A2H3CRC3_9AGAR|nr:hypothetical protein ARMSODRAFT_1011228 [Armillaria solidipes]